MDETELVRRYLDGDVGAFDELLRLHLPAAYRYAYARLGNRCRAEDCVQEASWLCWDRRHSFRPDAPFWPWFRKIVQRRCQEDMRRNWWSRVISVGLGRARDWQHDDDHDDEVWLTGCVENVRLRRAFARLSGQQQEAAYLYFVEDRSQDDVARELRTSVVAVKALIYKARKALRAALEDGEEEV